MILKNLFRRKFRTLLTILGISLGVAAIIGLGAMAEGTRAGYQSMFSGSKADVVLTQANSMDVSMSLIDDSISPDLAAFPEVEDVTSMLEGFVQADGAPYFFCFGYPKDSFALERFQIIDGVDFNNREAMRLRGSPILLGSAASESLNKTTGDTIRLGNTSFRIIGIYQTGDAFEDGGAVFLLDDAQDLLGKHNKVSVYYIKLKENADSAKLQTRIERKWTDFSMSESGDLSDKQYMSQSLDAFTWAIAGLAILLGGVGMMNAQLMSVYERTREIGVLRAVGWSRRQIVTMIMGETLVVCLIGGLIGIAIGIGIVALVAENTVMMGMDPRSIGPGLILQSMVTVILLGLFGGIYPALKASQLQPIEALRYEGGSSGARVHRLPIGGMALQSLWQRSTRTLLTLSVIAITVGAIIYLESLVNGFSKLLGDMAFGSTAQIMIRQADIADTSQSAISERDGDKISAMPEVNRISGLIFTGIMMPEASGFFILQGLSPKEFGIQNLNVIDGKRLDNNHQIMLGKQMADALKKSVGDTIELSGFRFKVVGIYASNVFWEELGGVVSLRDAQSFTGRQNKVTMYSVELNNPAVAPKVVERINRDVPGVHASLAGEFASQMPDIQSTESMMVGISFLALLVGGIGVMNTMLMSVLERTREIGVLRAVGWRRLSVMNMIMREALLLALLGGLAGILLAFGLALALGAIPQIGGLLKPAWEITSFIRAIMVALLLGVTGGIYPSLRATQMQPVEALRYE